MSEKRAKRRRHGSPSPLEAFQRKVRREGLLDNVELISGDPTGPKLSEVLLELIDPLTQLAETREAMEKLVVLGLTAWNAALFDAKERQEMIDDLMKVVEETAGAQGREDAEALIQMLVERKLALFPHDRRYVVEYHLAEVAEGYHLSVAGMLRPEANDAKQPGA